MALQFEIDLSENGINAYKHNSVDAFYKISVVTNKNNKPHTILIDVNFVFSMYDYVIV